MRRLIVNGDDFGLAPAINDGIIRAHLDGCLTSASLSVNGPAAEEAAALALRHPTLGVGLHLTLVDERPVCDLGSVASLVGADGRLPASGTCFALAWLAGRLRSAEVRCEVRAQLQRIRDLGIQPTHLDSHDHVHVLPGLFGMILEEMAVVGLARVRVPLEHRPSGAASLSRRARGAVMQTFAWRAGRLAQTRGVWTPDDFCGFRGAGSIDEQSLLARLRRLGSGVTELAVHPATGSGPPRADMAPWGYHWGEEFHALTSIRIRRGLERRGIELIRYDACGRSLRAGASAARRRSQPGTCPS